MKVNIEEEETVAEIKCIFPTTTISPVDPLISEGK